MWGGGGEGTGLESHLQTVGGGTRTCQDGGEGTGVRISPSDSWGGGEDSNLLGWR